MEGDLEYYQQLAIRYLRPPTPPEPGEVSIIMEPDIISDPAPPVIIRQQQQQARTPDPIIIREAPPQIPPPVSPIHITIPGKRLEPPPRKVIIERLPVNKKPQKVLVDRWLPYKKQKRKVFLKRKTASSEMKYALPKNVIVQWEAPQVNITQAVKYLGVVDANPYEYHKAYGASFKFESDFPAFARNIPIPIDIKPKPLEWKKSTDSEFEGK